MRKFCPICQDEMEDTELPQHMESAHKGSVSPEIDQMRRDLAQQPDFKCMVCHVSLPSPEAVRDHHHEVHGL
jgi:hypothetical protein